MKLIISTQDHENYGDHSWDGEGECPQRWKAKGGHDYVLDIPEGHISLMAVLNVLRPCIEESNDYYTTDVIGTHLAEDTWKPDLFDSYMEHGDVFPMHKIDLLGQKWVEYHVPRNSTVNFQEYVDYYGEENVVREG